MYTTQALSHPVQTIAHNTHIIITQSIILHTKQISASPCLKKTALKTNIITPCLEYCTQHKHRRTQLLTLDAIQTSSHPVDRTILLNIVTLPMALHTTQTSSHPTYKTAHNTDTHSKQTSSNTTYNSAHNTNIVTSYL